MKILFATDCYLPSIGGIELTTSRLANFLSKKGHSVSIIAPSINKQNYFEKVDGIKIFRVGSILTPLHKSLRYALPLNAKNIAKQILNLEKPDMIHIQTSASIAQEVLKVAKKLNIPVTATSHFMTENISENIPVGKFKIPALANKLIDDYVWNETAKLVKNADGLSTPTNLSLTYLKKKINTDKNIRIISNGINLSIFNQKTNGDYLLKRHKIQKGIPVILYVGRMDKDKKVDVIIKSLSKILGEKEVKLILVGKGGELENLKKLSSSLNLDKNIIFAGFVKEKDVPNYYAIASVFAIASTDELQSIATLQAAASGVPVVAANAAALPELIENGKNGYLFSPGNTRDLANKVIKILENKNLSKKMGEVGIKIAEKHNIDNVVEELEDLYRNAILINSRKNFSINKKSFVSRPVFVKFTLAMVLFAIFFRFATLNPSAVHSKALYLEDKIENSKIVKKMKNIKVDLKSKVSSNQNGNNY